MTGRRFPATFYDGMTSRPHDVELELTPSALRFQSLDGAVSEAWPLAQIRNQDEAVAGRALNLACGETSDQRLIVTELEAVYAVLRLLPARQRSLVRVRASVPWVAGLLVACVATVIALPFAVKSAAAPLARLVPVEWETPLAELFVPELTEVREEARKRPCETAAERQELLRIVDRLREDANLDRRVDVIVSPSEEINAFALPGGIVMVNRGLIKFAENDEELAGIIAHEIGHLMRRHTMESLINSVGLRVVLGAMTGGSENLANLTSAGAGLYELGYSRDHEREADQSAVEYMRAAGKSTDALRTILERIEKKEALLAELSKHDFLTYISTHPPLKARMDVLRDSKKPDKKTPPFLTKAQWAQLKDPGRACPKK